MHALRTDDLAEMARLIGSSRDYLTIARDAYQREDAEILIAVLDLVVALSADSRAKPTVTASDDPLLSPENIDALVEKANRFNVSMTGLEHWFGDAKRASITAWVTFAGDLRKLKSEFSQDSFYQAEVVVDDLLQIYVASRSASIVKSSEDLGGVLQVVQPVIESGFAAKAGLLAHLEQHVQNLEKRVARGDYNAGIDHAEQLGAAQDVLAKAKDLGLRRGGSGKEPGGAATAPLPQPLDRLFPLGSPEASRVSRLGNAVLEKLADALQDHTRRGG